MTYQVGAAGGVRTSFLTNGTLNNTVNTRFGAINKGWPIFAFAHDLGAIVTTNTASVVYTVGYIRDPLVQLSNIPNVNGLRAPYYATRYSNVTDMVRPPHALYASSADVFPHRSLGFSMTTRILWCAQRASTTS